MPKKAANNGLYRKKDASGNPFGSWLLPIMVDGKRIIRSTDSDDLIEAKRKIPHTVQRLMEELGKSQRQTREDWTIEKLFSETIQAKQAEGCGKGTLNQYRLVQRMASDYFGASHKIEMLTYESILDFARKAQAREIKGIKDPSKIRVPKLSTISRHLVIFRAALGIAFSRKALSVDPASLFCSSFRKRSGVKKRFLTPEEFQTLLSVTESRWRARHLLDYWKVYVLLGLRRRELFRITRRDINLVSKRIQIRGTKTDGSDATLPIPDMLIEVFQRRLLGKGLDEALFHEPKSIHITLGKISKAAGIGHVTVHDLRRTTGSILISSGASLRVVQEIMRHADIRVTASHYAHLLPNVAPDALNALGSLMQPALMLEAAE